MRIGLFGGSFDPVHLGHLAVAKACLEQLGLQRLICMPAAANPIKPAPPAATGEHRVAMLRLALEAAGEPLRSAGEVSTWEVERGGPSYTVDSLRQLAAQHPDAQIHLLVGADALADLPKWREVGEICRLARLAAFERPPLEAAKRDDLRRQRSQVAVELERKSVAATPLTWIEAPRRSESSSEIRRRIAAGEPWAHLTLAVVADYIRQQRLYGAS